MSNWSFNERFDHVHFDGNIRFVDQRPQINFLRLLTGEGIVMLTLLITLVTAGGFYMLKHFAPKSAGPVQALNHKAISK